MADLRVRKNERCVIGIPECNYAFSSTNSCFIAYGYETSGREKDILIAALEKRGIEPIETAGQNASGEFAFCTKICSKIITSRFSIVLLNEDVLQKDGYTYTAPNANVNIEYGLMIGFNKVVIPFQEESYTLPFNVNAIDTVKYTSRTFTEKASKAIDDALNKTSVHKATNVDSFGLALIKFLLHKEMLIAPSDGPMEKVLHNLGAAFGLDMLNTFDGMDYHYLGNWPSLPLDKIISRLNAANRLFEARVASFDERALLGLTTDRDMILATRFIEALKFWIIVASEDQRVCLCQWHSANKFPYPVDIYLTSEIMDAARLF